MVFRQKDGDLVEQIISPIKYCAAAQEWLLSITNEMSSQGAKLSSNSRNDIILSYPNRDKVTFDRCAKTRDGWVSGIDVVLNHDKIANLARQTGTKSAATEGQGDKKRKANP